MGKGALKDLQALPEAPDSKYVSKDVADSGSSDADTPSDAVLSIESARLPVNEDTTMRRSANW